MPIVPRELHGFRLIGFALGNFGLYLINIFVSVFIFQFYVYTINLNSILVSIGISLDLVLIAIFAIIFGVISDNKKPGKFGKRRPFLIYGLPTWLLTNVLIWIPPWYCPENNSMFWPTAIYLWIVLIAKDISGTLITTVYASMFPEQSQTYENRAKVASINTILVITASIFAMMIPLIVQGILDNPENVKWWEPSGKTLLFYLPLIGSSFAIFGLITIILTFFSVDERFHMINGDDKKKKASLLIIFHQMIRPAKDYKFSKFLAVEFNTNLCGRIMGILIVPLLTYVLNFRENDFYIYTIVSAFSKFGWYFALKGLYKKHGLTKTYLICLTLSVMASLLELIFLITSLSFELTILFFIITIGTLLGATYGFGLFASPIASALINEAAIKLDGKNLNKAVSELSGSYFGLYSFTASIGSAIASLMLGFILSGPREENPTIISVCFASMGIFYLISVLFLRQIKINEQMSEFKAISK